MGQISHKPQHKRNSKYADVMYFVAILGPLLTIPQLLKIWHNKSASELSLMTWFSYFSISLLWFIYGLRTKDKPLMVCNFLYLVVNLLIVISINYWNH